MIKDVGGKGDIGRAGGDGGVGGAGGAIGMTFTVTPKEPPELW